MDALNIERTYRAENRMADLADKAEEEIRKASDLREREIGAITTRLRNMTVDADLLSAIVNTLTCEARKQKTVHTLYLDAIEEAICDLGGAA